MASDLWKKGKTMFTVYDNGRLARYPEVNVGASWDNCSFPTFEAAVSYAKQWLGQWDTLPPNWDGSSYNYDGYGDTIEIREE